MAQYAYFDSTKPAPQPVIGWIDTVAMPGSLGTLAPADLLELTSAQWPTASQRVSGSYVVQGGALVAVTVTATAPTLAQQATAALAAGLAITSTSTPALNGTYPCDAKTTAKVTSIDAYIAAHQAFPSGLSGLPWPDITGAFHTFGSTSQFTAFATALADYATLLDLIINGAPGITALPAATATIP